MKGSEKAGQSPKVAEIGFCIAGYTHIKPNASNIIDCGKGKGKKDIMLTGNAENDMARLCLEPS